MIYLLTLLAALSGLLFARERTAYLYPLIGFFSFFFITSMVDSPYVNPGFSLSDDIANVIRLAMHMTIFFALMAWLVKIGKVKLNGVALVPLILFLVFCIISISLQKDVKYEGLLRVSIFLVFILNAIVLVPSASFNLQFESVLKYTLFLSCCLIGLCVLSFLIYGPAPEWTTRLGRPMNARVLAEVVVIGSACAGALYLQTGSNKWFLVTLLFTSVLLWTGSRAPLVLTVLFIFHIMLQRRMYRSLLAMSMLGVVGVFWVGADLAETIFNRTEVSSGRLAIWQNALADIESVWFGQGERYIFPGGSLPEGMRLHNGFLETYMSFGIFAAISAFLFYIVIMVKGIHRGFFGGRPYILFIALSLFSESMIGTSFLLNLGDGFIFYALSLLFTFGRFGGEQPLPHHRPVVA